MVDHGVTLEIFYGGAWHPVPVYTRDAVQIMRGSNAFGQQLQPGSVKPTVDNRTLTYSPRNVSGALYGILRQNMPARMSIDGSVRITGETAIWKPERAIYGDAWTRLTVAGVLQRIGRGTDPLASPIQRSILPLAPAVYHPMTDGRNATSATDLIGGEPMAVVGAPSLAAVAGPGAGDTSHPELVGSAGYLGGFTNTFPASSTGEWTYEFGYLAVAPADNAKAVVASWHVTGTYGAEKWLCYVAKSGGVHGVVVVAHHDPLTASAFNETAIPLLDGKWHQVRVTANQDTATQVTISMYVDGVLVDGTTVSPYTVGNLVNHTIGDYGGFYNSAYPFAAVESLSVSNVAAWNDSAPASTATAFAGYIGETADDRFLRLCLEEGISASLVGTADETVLMGPQTAATLLDQFAEIERTDDATIFEARDSAGLVMRTGSSKLNQTPDLTLYYDGGQIAQPLEPVVGDEGIRNDVTASSTSNGTIRRVEQTSGPYNTRAPGADPQGVGRYSTRVDVNPSTDDALSDAAGWRVNQGTYDGTWYAAITVDLDAAPALTAAVAALDIGDCVALARLPVDEALDVVDHIVIGILENAPAFRRLVTFFCVPGAPFRVGKLAATTGDTDPFVGHLESDGSATNGITAARAAKFVVHTPAGPLWTTAADDFPFDVIVGGQRVTVSAIGAVVSDNFNRVAANGFGVEPASGVTYTVVGAAGDYSATGAVARMSLGSLSVLRRAQLFGLDVAGFDVTVVTTISALLTGAGAQADIGMRLRYIDDNNFVEVLIFRSPTNVTMAIHQRVGGVDTTVGFPGVSGAAGNSSITIRFVGTGTTLQAWVWVTGSAQPATPTASMSGVTMVSAGGLELNAVLNASVTNALPLFVDFEDLVIATPQRFTVDPAGRQIVYPIAAGSILTVQQPVILSL